MKITRAIHSKTLWKQNMSGVTYSHSLLKELGMGTDS